MYFFKKFLKEEERSDRPINKTKTVQLFISKLNVKGTDN